MSFTNSSFSPTKIKRIKDLIKKTDYLRVKVAPNKSLTKVVSIMDDETVKIDLNAAPEKGNANDELIKYLAKALKISKTKIRIISGRTSTLKMLRINLN